MQSFSSSVAIFQPCLCAAQELSTDTIRRSRKHALFVRSSSVATSAMEINRQHDLTDGQGGVSASSIIARVVSVDRQILMARAKSARR
jgi:hypothetical protein